MKDTTQEIALRFTPEPARGLTARFRRWRNRKVADPGFQSWASRMPFTRGRAAQDGTALFDIVAGFVNAQVLFALVQLDILRDLRDAPATAQALGAHHGIETGRMIRLLDAAVALDLLERSKRGYQTARQGAALLGVPGLDGMIRHHDAFYRDMADPVALLRGETQTELARFWPYVFGAGSAQDPGLAERYSALMADSQSLVAEETLRAIDFENTHHLMDVGGGTGAFLTAAAATQLEMALTLFDLPAVVPAPPPGLRPQALPRAPIFSPAPSAMIRCPKGRIRSALFGCSMTTLMQPCARCCAPCMTRCQRAGALLFPSRCAAGTGRTGRAMSISRSIAWQWKRAQPAARRKS